MSNSIDWKFLSESQKFQMKGLSFDTLHSYVKRLPIMNDKNELEMYQFTRLLYEFLNPRR